MTAHQQPPRGSVPMRGYPDQWEPYSPRERLLRWLWLAGIAVAAAWSVSALDIEWAFFADAHEQAADLIERMWPPRWSYLPRIVQPLIETLHIATLGTMIAIVFALPVAFLAARNDVLVNVAIIVMGLITAATLSGWPDIVLGAIIIVLNVSAAKEVWEAAENENLAAQAMAGDLDDD